MDFNLGQQLSARLRLNICTCLLMVTILAVSGERTLDSIYQTDSSNKLDFQTLWDVYILPRLEYDLSRKYGNTLELPGEDSMPRYEDYPDSPNTTEDRPKRERSYHITKRIAGLENLDMMTKILDRARTTPLRTNFGFSQLQARMREAGRRRK